MKYEEIRKQIEDELNYFIDLCPRNLMSEGIAGRKIYWLYQELIESRKTISAQQETIDNFILGRREE
jgi:hypothetical protein